MLATKHLLKLLMILIACVGVLSLASLESLAQDAKDAKESAESSAERIAKILKTVDEETAKRTPIPAYRDARDEYKEDELAKRLATEFPQLDLTGKHNIQKVANPPKGAEREAYTNAMLEVVDFWLDLDMGAMLNKILVLQNQDNVTNPTLMVLAAHFAIEYGLSLDNANLALAKALEIDPDFIAAHYQSAFYFMKRNLVNSAMKHLNIVLKADPKHVRAHFLKASIYYQLADTAKARDECEALLRLLPKNRVILRSTIELLSSIDTDYAEKVCNEILPEYETAVQANDVIQGLARLSFMRKNYEEAKSLALDLLKREIAKTDWDFAYNVRREVLLLPLKEQIFAARSEALRASGEEKTKIEARLASLTQQMEAAFRENIELDLEHFGPAHAYKGEAVRDFSTLYVYLKRNKDALEVLQDYDRRVALIPARKREVMRELITRLRVTIEGRVDTTVMGQKFEARRFGEVANDLRGYLQEYERDKEKFDFDDAKLIDLLLEMVKSTDRAVAGAAMALLGASGAQSDDAETKLKIRDAILARLASEGVLKTAEQYTMVGNGCKGLQLIRSKESALALIDFLEGEFEVVNKADSGDFADAFKDFWRTAVSLVQPSNAKLSEREFQPGSKVTRLRGSGFEKDVSEWAKLIRDELNKE